MHAVLFMRKRSSRRTAKIQKENLIQTILRKRCIASLFSIIPDFVLPVCMHAKLARPRHHQVSILAKTAVIRALQNFLWLSELSF